MKWIILAVILISFFIAGAPADKKSETKSQSANSTTSGQYQCCDSGNGNECRTLDKSIRFEGRTYRLIKSDIALTERWGHLRNTGELASDGTIFENSTAETNFPQIHPSCGPDGNDLLFKGGQCQSIGSCCFSVPDDSVIYVCKNGCEGTRIQAGFGTFDAYILDGAIIPDEIKNCGGANPFLTNLIPPGEPGGDIIIFPSPDPSAKNTVQINNLKIVTRPQNATPWLSPYCKPAIYLYPEKQTQVSIKVLPKGKITYTWPPYPKDGWLVMTHPNGQINYQGESFDYLYYEVEIPDELINKPDKGYITIYNKLSELFDNLLPKLGLNQKEKLDFKDYWTVALPQANYYFVGVMPTKDLDLFAPLDITPKPTKVIRVTLYFEPLENYVEISQPKIVAPKREGFTVLEWGGIFKSDGNINFSCLM